MITQLLSKKPDIDIFLTNFLTEKKIDYAKINKQGPDFIDHVLNFITSGKSLRGCLVPFSASLFSRQYQHEAVQIGASLELIHSAFLIHDDIMDEDELRRGNPTIHTHYAVTKNNQHFGESMAINLGDLCMFWAYEVLHQQKNGSFISKFVSKEFQKVVLGQIADIEAEYSANPPTASEILSMYTYKTARYTFSVPLIAGAILTDQPAEMQSILGLLGESMGVLYQIQDDELSITGDVQITGKPVGNDLTHDKKTLRSVMETRELIKVKTAYITNAERAITALPVSPEKKQILHALLEFCHTRLR